MRFAGRIPAVAFPADWQKHGKRAGPIRNALMLAEGKPDLVIGFAGGKGTDDMLRKAFRSGVKRLLVARRP